MKRIFKFTVFNRNGESIPCFSPMFESSALMESHAESEALQWFASRDMLARFYGDAKRYRIEIFDCTYCDHDFPEYGRLIFSNHKRAQILVEYTDTYGGEANYSWCERKRFTIPADLSSNQIVRRAKKALGLTGVKFYRESYGDQIKLKESRACRVMFIDTIY